MPYVGPTAQWRDGLCPGHDLHCSIELIDERNAIGDAHIADLLVVQFLQMLDEATQAVRVGHHKDVLPHLDVGFDLLIVEDLCTNHTVFQRFSEWNLRGVQVFVFSLVGMPVWVAGLHWWRAAFVTHFEGVYYFFAVQLHDSWLGFRLQVSILIYNITVKYT